MKDIVKVLQMAIYRCPSSRGDHEEDLTYSASTTLQEGSIVNRSLKYGLQALQLGIYLFVALKRCQQQELPSFSSMSLQEGSIC